SEVLNNVVGSRESDKDDNQVNDRFKKGEGYHAVPPPYTGNYIPPRADLSFAGLDNFVFKSKVSETITSVPKIETNTSKTHKDGLEKPKTVRSSVLLIKECESDSKDKNVFKPKEVKKIVKPSLEKIEFVNARNITVENENKAKKPRKFSQSPSGTSLTSQIIKQLMVDLLHLEEILKEVQRSLKMRLLMMLERKLLKFQERRMEFRIQQKKNNDQEKDLRDQKGALRKQCEQEFKRLFGQKEAANTNSTNSLNTVSSPINVKDERGIVVRNKARLVAQDYTQEEGIDCDEVFAPVARIEAIRLFLAYASFIGFIVYKMDVKSAFLYGIIEEEVYVCQPPGFEDLHFPNKVYKVEKALYGLHQAPRAWYETLSTYLLENGFRRRIIDKTLFIKKDEGDLLLVQVYVDDIIFGSTKKSLCIEFKGLMHKKFQISSMGELTFFLGLQVMQRDDGIFISQDKYVADILKKFDFSSVKTASTLIEINKALLKDKDDEDVDVHLYRSMTGSSMYLTTSRPYIMFTVCACARFQVTPKVSHLYAVKRIFRNLKGQPKLGLWYHKDPPLDLGAFSDIDYARASLDRKFTTGGCQFLRKRQISWQCKKQTLVANSTTKAEYIIAAN
nr:putative ribonuclease H-like domain-containing protein [Tanacetum cinerariifolium]